jgi:hypothetical protein
MMDQSTKFDLWCEFEELGDDFNPENDFSDVMITFADGRRYLLKVWTFQYVQEMARQKSEA